MDTSTLKRFAQSARRQLREQVAARLEQVLRTDSAELREKKAAIAELRLQIEKSSQAAVIDQAAYTWFNRLCALRFMDANHYTRLGIVSPQQGFTQPEILQEAKQGVIDADFPVDRGRVLGLLNGQLPSANPQAEAYRLLLVAACNFYSTPMPFMFEKIEDYTELLMPADLLSENSILQAVREALIPEACQDEEVIGWLYQYYISERKDEVFANLKQGRKIAAEDIPAATQLFTPHWIVCYLVENSLGRLWMLNHPGSKLVEHMPYYIRPEQDETDFLRIASPEEIKLCDTACGSGHMLTYAFDLMYLIYAEAGYDPVEIPRLILQNNLYGIEIDPRAGALAAFALTMKARAKDRRFLQRGVTPNICVLENISFTASELDAYMQAVGRDLFTQDLWLALKQFENAKIFGSLIRPQLKDVAYIRSRLQEKGVFGNLFLHSTNQKVQQLLTQVEYLSSRYHIVVTNPPYAGFKNLNEELHSISRENYPISKSDLYAMFIERNIGMVSKFGFISMITMDSWMYGTEYNELRQTIISAQTILTLAHLGPGAFDEIKGEVVQTAAFILKNSEPEDSIGIYFRLVDARPSSEKANLLLLKLNRYCVAQNYFQPFPRNVLAYYANQRTRESFQQGIPLREISEAFTGLQTGENGRFIRLWSEVSWNSIAFGCNNDQQAIATNKHWFPYVKGSDFRKWYGNISFVLNWWNNGEEIRRHTSSTIRNSEYYFQEGLAYNNISKTFCARYVGIGFIFDQKNSMFFSGNHKNSIFSLGFLNSKVILPFLEILSPKDFNPGSLKVIPISKDVIASPKINEIVKSLIEVFKTDWDLSETSWDFSTCPLLVRSISQATLNKTYKTLRRRWKEITLEAQRLEEENHRIFINEYGLQGELDPSVLSSEITLTINPHYRYPNTNRNRYTEEELESLLLADTMREFISYAVGCMFGRYSLDKPGLILANQGESAEDYLRQVPHPSFPPDVDNVIPILDEGWFADDIAERFKKFLRVTFGEEHFTENLAFLEAAIGKDIRSYFLKDFYAHHVQMYKNRPIYWLFSSPKGAFNALISMHRYPPDTVSVILNGYLREYARKLHAHQAHLEQVSLGFGASQAEKTKALKEIDLLNRVLAELKEYEDEVLYPLATRRIAIDLDDGVKVNYARFGRALKAVKGLEAQT